MVKYKYSKLVAALLLPAAFLLGTNKVKAQAEVTAWGNITAIRTGGQPFNFETSICLVNKDWKSVYATALEQQSPKYNRNGSTQIITTKLDSIYLTEEIKSSANGKADVSIDYTAKKEFDIAGLYFRIDLDDNAFGSILKPSGGQPADLKQLVAQTSNSEIILPDGRFELGTADHLLKVTAKKGAKLIVRQNPATKHLQLYIPLQEGKLANGDHDVSNINLAVSGLIDTKSIIVSIDPTKPGRLFDGFGGNFRLQNPTTDPQVIDYCLDNMRVSWGRVEMPLSEWQPDMDTDPIAAAKNGQLNPHVKKSMEMAQKLQKMGIPVILTSWTAPNWAIIGEPNIRHKPGGEWGNQLKAQTIQKAYQSIADYIVYLKDAYGVDVTMFSFNESDLGINIRVTPQEHNELIKGLGAYFVSRGLKTKMLLGDNSDANSYEFIYPALNDPKALPYIGAISFHSWRGWETATLTKWAEAAKKVNLPLIVGEGSIDAAAWAYPKIFEEEAYARQEMSLYLKLLTVCQPLSILQWQLTADYSPLIGGGIFRNNEPLHPGQRFWNLKQFASTPKDVYYMPAATQAANVSCAVLGNTKSNAYALHFVNSGPTRDVEVTGLPNTLKTLIVYNTSEKSQMKKSAVAVVNGKAKFSLKSLSFTSLISADAR